VGGATKYMQQALNNLGVPVKVDGAIGPKTISAINQVDPKSLMLEASKAQWSDELRMASKNPDRKKFLNGLQNRINNRFALFGSG
jgi:lysozyme family protein